MFTSFVGGGSMVGAIAGSCQREPLVVGKPSTFMMDYLANKYVCVHINCLLSITSHSCLMNFSTADLAFPSHKYAWLGTDWIQIFCSDRMVAAKPFLFSPVTHTSLPQSSSIFIQTPGIWSEPRVFFSSTGVTSLSMLQSPSNSIQPDFYTNKISDFLSLKAAAVWSWMYSTGNFVLVIFSSCNSSFINLDMQLIVCIINHKSIHFLWRNVLVLVNLSSVIFFFQTKLRSNGSI